MEPEKQRALVVSKERGGVLATLLLERGLEVALARDLKEASTRFEGRFFDVALVEADVTTLDVTLEHFRHRSYNSALVLFGDADETMTSIRARRGGAVDYLSWPIEPARLTLTLEVTAAQAEAEPNDPALEAPDLGLIGVSPQIVALRETIARVANGEATILVRGENGTGKEVVARGIHAQGNRRSAPFIKVHTPGLPDSLVESELFGYDKGAFTGATMSKPGRVELAEGGTLFLDEVAEVALPIQAKLLRLAQDREFERLGGTRTLKADVRLVAATHRDIEHMLENRTFREDLFYRLNVVTLWLPPLRARRGDIALITQHYLVRLRAANGRPNLVFDESAVNFLETQRWPGNVRQLVNFVERMVVLTPGDVVTEQDIRRELTEQTTFVTQSVFHGVGLISASLRERASPTSPTVATPPTVPTDSNIPSAVRPLREDLRRAERRALEKALLGARGNRSLAARMLGVSRRTLYTKLSEHDLI